MRAIVVNEYGGPEVFQLGDTDVPEPGPRQVLIKMHAAALNYSDIQIAGDFYPGHIPRDLPYVAGREGAGEVAAVGEAVSGVEVGQRVMALGLRGAFAEYAVAMPQTLVPIVDDMSSTAAAGIQLPHLAAIAALEACGQLEPEQTVLIHAGASSVGQAMIRLAKDIGAHVITTASSSEKLEVTRQLGADCCLNYVDADFVPGVKDFAPQGVDLAIDTVGGSVLERTLTVMRPYGRLVIAGNASNTPVTFNHYDMLSTYRCAIVTMELGTMIIQRPDLMAGVRQRYAELFDRGVFVVEEPTCFPLTQGPDALQKMADRALIGATVLEIQAS